MVNFPPKIKEQPVGVGKRIQAATVRGFILSLETVRILEWDAEGTWLGRLSATKIKSSSNRENHQTGNPPRKIAANEKTTHQRLACRFHAPLKPSWISRGSGIDAPFQLHESGRDRRLDKRQNVQIQKRQIL
jgi:hypothetical protein